MTILDTNGLIYCLENNKSLGSALPVTEDLRDEYETALLLNGNRQLEILDISELPSFDEAFYLKEYAHYLNIFPGVAMASMRGLTDASILALVSCLVNNFGGAQQTHLDLGDTDDSAIVIITGDGNLANWLRNDFGDKVEVKHPKLL